MATQYRISRKAREDLIRLHVEGVRLFGRRQAGDYVANLKRVLELIGESPKIARLRTELTPPVRVHPHGSHLIFYEERNGFVLIIRIRHASENWTHDLL